eukprot:TRINITY_DN1454_c0_g1_i2.p2 TRINITY_DN1454_c0_g1~~TRINITY_DN1454_c0_g1_i2.p2  ORF type:complete len:317 (-),score=39.83 TRINITY_DN1454_c0_g1_i2:1441-2391(-)
MYKMNHEMRNAFRFETFKTKIWLRRWMLETDLMDTKEEEEESSEEMFYGDDSSEENFTLTYDDDESEDLLDETCYVDIIFDRSNKKRKRNTQSRSIQTVLNVPSDFNSPAPSSLLTSFAFLPHKKRRIENKDWESSPSYITEIDMRPIKQETTEYCVVKEESDIKSEQFYVDVKPIKREKSAHVEVTVKEVLAKTGVSAESIINLINNKEERSSVLEQTGFSNNYIMKLQRKVLRSSKVLQLKDPNVHMINSTSVHVLFDRDLKPLFIKKELCQVLDMKGTTFSYWKKKSKYPRNRHKPVLLFDVCFLFCFFFFEN